MNEAKEEKQRCQYELWVNEYFGLPENFPERATCTDFDYGQLVNMLAMFDEKRNEFHRRNLSDAMHERDLENASLRDQLSKERREKEKLKELHIHQETHLNDQFEKEREMRKELVDALKIAKREIVVGGKEFWEIEPIVFQMESAMKKASELDKNH